MEERPVAAGNRSQAVKKAEVQEALPPAGVSGAEPLSLVPQHFFREPAKRCSRALAANQGFSTVWGRFLREPVFFFAHTAKKHLPYALFDVNSKILIV